VLQNQTHIFLAIEISQKQHKVEKKYNYAGMEPR
jgi:hypothetical protein